MPWYLYLASPFIGVAAVTAMAVLCGAVGFLVVAGIGRRWTSRGSLLYPCWQEWSWQGQAVRQCLIIGGFVAALLPPIFHLGRFLLQSLLA